MLVSFKKANHTLIVSLEGELDHHNASRIREQIDEKFTVTHSKNMIINLKNLHFMDSSGLGVLIGRYKTVSAAGGKIAVAEPSSTTKELISLSGIHKIMPVFSSLDEALGGAV